VEEYGGKICTQMRRLGTSCDWSRQAYTMDPQLSAAVKEAFLRLHADGLIYRDVRLVNWDCRLQTAVSESEVTPPPLLPILHFLGMAAKWKVCAKCCRLAVSQEALAVSAADLSLCAVVVQFVLSFM